MKTRKILSVLLAVMLIIGLVQMPVFAENLTVPAAAGDETVVQIPDKEFQKLLNQTLDPNRAEDAAITVGDMKSLTYLTLSITSDVTNIEGIQHAENLTHLSMSGDIQGLQQLHDLEQLTRLSITNNDYMTDLSQLGAKPVLEQLDLYNCDKLMSLRGLTAENYPKLQVLDCPNCDMLSDISALRDQEINTLKDVDFGDSDAITDITPLHGYDLETLDLEKIMITPENRADYQETIRSLTNLTELYLPYCGVTDADTGMFSTLTQLNTLVLNMNELTNTNFCDRLPAGIETLGLHGNEINNMDNLSKLTNLKNLGFGDNFVTDFTFVQALPSLTPDGIRHEEGSEGFRFRETYSYGSQSNPIEIENGQITLDNPYIGVDGQPVPFTGAEVTTVNDSTVTVSYDAAENTVTLGNIPDSASVNDIMVAVKYDMPVPVDGPKLGELRIQAYVKTKIRYTINYDWGSDAPDGRTLPSDTTEYQSLDAARDAVDTTFTDQTVVKGEKNGKTGTWTFSGWTVTVTGRTVNAKGSWSFTEDHQHTWGQPVYTWTEDGKRCTATRVCTGDSSHVESETVDAAGKVTTPASCTAMGQTTYTAAFTSNWAQTQTKVLTDVEKLPHSYGAGWESDGTGHWHVCAACNTKGDQAKHDFAWIVDQEATETQAGSRHQECTVCGYALTAVAIPPVENPEDTEQSDVPQTEDTGNPLLWLLVCAAAACGLGTTLLVNRKQNRR